MRQRRMLRSLLALPVIGVAVAAMSLNDLPASPVVEVTGVEPAGMAFTTGVLHGTVLSESDRFGAPTDVEVMGLDLVIADDFAEQPLSLLRRSDGAHVRSFGRKGKGPREFESAWSLDVIDPSGEFMVHDVMLQRVTLVDMKTDFDGDRWVADHSVKLNANAMLTETAWAPDGMVGLGTFAEGRLGHLASDGRLLRTSGPTPLEGQEVPPEVRQQAYQSKLKASPSRDRWVVATRYADRLEIYDASGSLVAQGDRPYGFEPVYQAKESAGRLVMATGPELRFGYIDLATTETRIYALFSGRTRAEGQANYGHRVLVFDWSGRLLEVLTVDVPLIALAAEPSGEELYGIRHEPLPAVLKFSLERAAGD